MAQRLGDLGKWRSLKGDSTEAAHFPGDARSVFLEVSAPQRTQLYVEYETSDEEGEVELKEQFLALVEGRDRVEFTVGGEFSLFCSGGDILFYTAEGQVVHNVDIAPVIFTRIANRKARNHNLELIEYKMRINLERRMEQMENDALQRLNDKVNRYAPQRNIKSFDEFAGWEAREAGATAEGSEPSVEPVSKAGADAGKGAKPAKQGKAPASGDD